MAIDTNLLIYTLLTIFVLRFLYLRIYDYLCYNYPPGPKGWPIVGNTFSIGLRDFHRSIYSHKEKYGEVSHVKVCGYNIVLLNSIDAFKEAMTDMKYKTVFSGRLQTFESEYTFANDLSLASYGIGWAKLRKIVHNAVTKDSKERELVISNELKLLKDVIEQNGRKAFDIYELITLSIGNMIFTLIMGERFEYDHAIHEEVATLCDLIDEMAATLNNGILTLFPFMRHIPLGIGKTAQRTAKSMQSVMKYLYHDVASGDIDNKKGLLYEMLRQKRYETWLTDENIHGVVADVLTAGIRTTGKTIYILLLVLLHQPNIQKKIHDEIDKVVGREAQPNLDDIVIMPYTNAVVLETLRFSSIVPMFLPHRAMEDVTFRGFHLKKDTVIVGNGWLLNHDADVWSRPWEFEPERFLAEDGSLVSAEHPNRRNMVVFGSGNRRCVGDTFARKRVFLFTTHLCQKFNFYNDSMDSVSSMDPRHFNVTSLLAPYPYKVQVEMRR